MRRLKICGNGRVTVETVPDPVPGQGEVVVETAVSALCGSELHDYRGGGVASGNNGHEAAGTIVGVGPGVTALSPGMRVGVSAIAGCGACAQCEQGRYTWCRHWRYYGAMHAERFLAAANACHRLPDDIGWDVGVLITGDGLGVPYHTETKMALGAGATVAVFGAGPIGLGNVLMQRHLGRRVLAVDISPVRRALAVRLGAEVALDPREGDVVAGLRARTNGDGADVCLECAGRPETALWCFEAVRTAGTVIFNGEQGALPLSPSEHFIRRDIVARGAWFYHFSEYPHMLRLVREGLDAAALISDQYAFEEADAAYAKFARGETAKVLLRYESA